MTLEPGQPAPDFSAPDQDGNLINLQDLRGQKVALYFYPKDDTPGCTAQACNLRDHQAELKVLPLDWDRMVRSILVTYPAMSIRSTAQM